jgi:DNA-binding NarL/FixJ family response regulator
MPLKNSIPIKVMIMDDDFYSLKWNTATIMRDPRTTVVLDSESPTEILTALKKGEKVDALLIDVEYKNKQILFEQFIEEIQELKPDLPILCLSQYGDNSEIEFAINKGVRAFLLKSEIKMSIVPAIMKSLLEEFVVTPGVKIEKLASNIKTHTIPLWVPNPKLTPQIMKSFWLRVFFGMRASLAAEEMGVATTTVERYINLAYQILPDTWADIDYLFDIDLSKLSAEDQAFIWFTLPPQK